MLNNWDIAFQGDNENEFSGTANELHATNVKRLFISYGTVITQYYTGDSLVYSTFRNWEWHPTAADSFIEYHKENIQDYRHAKIKTLTATTLTVDEMIIEGENDPYVSNTLYYSIGAQPATRKNKNPLFDITTAGIHRRFFCCPSCT